MENETKEMGFKDWQLEDIVQWCKDHGEVAWLKAEAAKTVERKVYPKVESVSKSGKKSWKLDKTQPYTIEYVPISFVELKSNFLAKFFDRKPKEKKPSMYDIIANL
jgi:hypothetical protein